MASSNPTSPTTAAFHAQAVASFAVAVTAVVLGVFYLPADAWIRAFLIVGVLYLVTSTFTLAKCIRDRQEAGALTSRVDQARLDRLLAEHDPYTTPA